MNYLAHLYLAGDQEPALIGNLLGDFVKGRVENLPYSPPIRRGIRQHRLVDSYSDSHPLVLRSKRRISPLRRRYAGIIIDLCYDHFLALHWSRLADTELEDFCRHAYRVLGEARPWLPAPMPLVVSRMIEGDWLGSYRQLDNVGRALDNIARRFRRPTPLPGAQQELERHYHDLEQDFLAFFPQLVAAAGPDAL